MGKLHNRVSALLRLDACMRGFADNPHGKLARTFARTDDIAVCPRGLEYQRYIHLTRNRLVEGSRSRRTKLLVTVKEECDLSKVAEARKLQGTQGIHTHEQSTFHVADTGTNDLVIFKAHGPGCYCAIRIDCIQVSYQQQTPDSITMQARQSAIAEISKR